MQSWDRCITSLDGSQYLSYGSIIVLTVNSLVNMVDEFKKPLLRKSRIDEYYIMHLDTINN